MKPAPESAIRVACLQMEPHVGEKERNVARTLKLRSKRGQVISAAANAIPSGAAASG